MSEPAAPESAPAPARPASDPPPAVVYERATFVRRDGTAWLADLDIAIEAGGHVAFVGPFGTGKSQLLQVAVGTRPLASGRVLVGGEDVAGFGYKALQAHRRRTGYVFGQDALLSNQNVFENIALPLRYYKRMDEDEVRDTVRGITEELDIGGYLSQRPSDCSLAVTKRVLIARALILEPALLLMEEPQTGLVPHEQHLVYAAVESRRAERGMTVVQTDHDGDFGPLRPERVLHFEDRKVVRDVDLGPTVPPARAS